MAHGMYLYDLRGGLLLVAIYCCCYCCPRVAAAATTTPLHPAAYYRFENITAPGRDSVDGSGAHDLAAPAAAASAARVQVQDANAQSVGNFVVLGYGLEGMPAGWPAAPAVSWAAAAPSPVPPGAPGITIEFLLHPTPQCFLRGGAATLLGSSTKAVSFSISYQALTWVARAQGDADGQGTLTIPLDGEGVLASDYLWATTSPAGLWHHIALVRDAATGVQSVWIDGERQASMTSTYSTAATGISTQGSTGMLDLGDLIVDAHDATSPCFGLDELAVFDVALSDTAVYSHYQDALVHHRPYTMSDPGGPPPPSPVYPNRTNASYFDAAEFTPGTVLPSPGTTRPGGGGNNTVCDECMTCLDQLRFAPAPGYNATALAQWHTPFNFNWMDPWHYLASQQVPRRLKYNVSEAIVLTLADRWRYGLMLDGGAHLNDTVALANAHPELPLHSVIPGERGALFNNSLPKGCYLQNAHGDFITILGDVIPAGQPRTLRPMLAATAAAQGCPDDIFFADNGIAVRDQRFTPLCDAGLRRPIDVLNCDGEVFIGIMSHRTPPAPAELYNYSRDPVTLTDFRVSGAGNWLTFFSEWRVRLTRGWSAAVMGDAKHGGDPRLREDVFAGTRFSMYQVMGTNPYFGNWSVTKAIGDPWTDRSVEAGAPDTHYSTFDFYLQDPNRWWTGAGPDHGIGWLETVRRDERAQGDALYSPFVAAGWSGQAERNLRPAQWLGLLKIHSVWGAEFFYTGFFSLRNPFQPSENWCWQAMMPAYAQALSTQFADFFYRGTLVLSTTNTSFSMGGSSPEEEEGGSPLLWAGAPNVLAVARELDGAYLLAVTIQRQSNNARNLGSIGDRVQGRLSRVRIPGLPTPVEVMARPQGSVFVYRKDSQTGKYVLRQLDAWHGAGHPLTWE